MDQATPRLNQHKSLLLRLPPELRNKIYEYTFAGHEISLERTAADAQPSFRYRPLSGRQAAWSPGPFRFGLQGACRQLHRETAHYRDLIYSLNAFHGLVDDITAFLQNPAIKKDRITVLHIDATTLVTEVWPSEFTIKVQAMLFDIMCYLQDLPSLARIVIISQMSFQGRVAAELYLRNARRGFVLRMPEHPVQIVLKVDSRR